MSNDIATQHNSTTQTQCELLIATWCLGIKLSTCLIIQSSYKWQKAVCSSIKCCTRINLQLQVINLLYNKLCLWKIVCLNKKFSSYLVFYYFFYFFRVFFLS